MTKVTTIVNNGIEVDIIFKSSELPDKLEKYNPINHKSNFYNEFYQDNGKSVSPLKTTRNVQYNEIFKRIKNIIKTQSSDATYIDIGTGPGDFVKFLGEKIATKTIIGIEPALNEKIEGNIYPYGIDDIGDAKDIPNKFDFIFMMDVLEHFENTDKTLQAIQELCNDESYVCFKVPNKDSLLYQICRYSKYLGHKMLWRMYQVDFPPPHYYYFNEKSLSIAAEKYFDKQFSFYLSELPTKGIYQRLWGMNPMVKLLFLPIAFVYNLITMGKLKDSLVYIGKVKRN